VRKRDVLQRAAKRFGVPQATMRRYVEMFLAEAGEVLTAGEPVSIEPLGRLYPIELVEDRRRKWRGVRFRSSAYFKGMMAYRPVTETTVLGEVTRIEG
jgi:hypothetical protein